MPHQFAPIVLSFNPTNFLTLASSKPGAPDSGIAGFALDLMGVIGGVGAGLLVAAENIFPPIPSEVILPIAGFAAAQGVISLASALIWTTVGSVLGALGLFWLGRKVGRDKLIRLLDRMPLMKVSDLERTEKWFARHGNSAVLIGRLLPVFRSLISVPAGFSGMGWIRFTVLTTIGSAAWNTLFVMAGYLLGANWALIEPYAGMFEKIIMAGVAIAVIYFVQHRLRQRA